jgi:hypothetical protein
MDDRSKKLQPFQNKRVNVVAEFTRFSYRSGQFPTACVADIRIERDGEEVEIDHLWIQEAAPFEHLALGRVKFTAIVQPYKHRDERGNVIETRYALYRPWGIEFVDGPTAVRIPPPVPDEEQTHPIFAPLPDIEPPIPPPEPEPINERLTAAQIIRGLRELAKGAGGWDELMDVAEAIRE